MSDVPTIKVASPHFEGGFRVIDAADFDETEHEIFDPEARVAEGAPPKRRGRPPKFRDEV